MHATKKSTNSESSADDNIKKWNPMEDDYKSKDFNSFIDGPGANLDDDLQPGAVASQGQNKKNYEDRYKLAFIKVPKEMTSNGLKNLCSNYGRVTKVVYTNKTTVRFVSFATFNDMTSALTKLSKNSYGMIVEVARQQNLNKSKNNIPQKCDDTKVLKSEEINDKNKLSPSTNDQNGKDNYKLSSSTLDMTRRLIKGPFAKTPRQIKVENEPFVTKFHYENSNLKYVDIHENFLYEYDMHYQDRNNKKDEQNNFNDSDQISGKQIYTGRSYYIESDKGMNHLKTLSNNSQGYYEPEDNYYEKFSSTKGISDDVYDFLSLVNECTNCKKIASKICEKCNAYYCSYECQKIDWQKHRLICVSKIKKKHQSKNDDDDENMKPSTSSSSSSKKNLKTKFNVIKSIPLAKLPKSGSHISITTICKPNLFYIRSLESEDNINYIKILNTINSKSINAKSLTKMPERGDICVTNFQNTGNYRVLVLNPINEQRIVVIYIDFGNIEEKKLYELKEPDASELFYDLKCYAIAVHLKNIPKDIIPTQKLRNYLNSFIDSPDIDLKLVYDGKVNDDNDDDAGGGAGGAVGSDGGRNNKSIKVEIINIAQNENLNKKILELNKIHIPNELNCPVYKFDIEHKILPSGKNIEVYVVDNSLLRIGYVSCILEKDLIQLQELNKQLKEYAEKTSDGPYTPRQSELCVVKYDNNEWYRAECLEVVGDENPSVLFIDYGNMLPVHISKIRMYPDDLKYFPCMTSNCVIKDVPDEIDEKLYNRLKQLIPANKKLIISEISSVKLDDESNLIYLPEIIQTLKNEGLM